MVFNCMAILAWDFRVRIGKSAKQHTRDFRARGAIHHISLDTKLASCIICGTQGSRGISGRVHEMARAFSSANTLKIMTRMQKRDW
jgi:hypothetical protein